MGVLSNVEALELAVSVGLDLVEVSPSADPPVCRVMDFGKFQYELKKQKNDAKKKQKKTQVKMIKYRPGTEEGDYQIKVNKIKSFLENGDKAKITLRFRGREMAHQQIGMALLKRVEADLEEMAKVEQFPVLEGRQLVMMMAPNKK